MLLPSVAVVLAAQLALQIFWLVDWKFHLDYVVSLLLVLLLPILLLPSLMHAAVMNQIKGIVITGNNYRYLFKFDFIHYQLTK